MADVLKFLVAVSILHFTWAGPQFSDRDSSHAASEPSTDLGPHSLSKAKYKAGEIPDMAPPITLDVIKAKLKETGIFNSDDPALSDREKKEMGKVFDTIEIMMTSRSRQPSNVQSVFTSLRLVERILKKHLKEGQISDSLAAKFHWENLRTRVRRDQTMYRLDENANMRIFKL